MDSLAHLRDFHAPRASQEWDREKGRYVPAGCLGHLCSDPAGYMGLPYCQRCTMHLWSKMDDRLSDEAKAAAKAGEFVSYQMRRQADWMAERRAEEAEEARRKRKALTRETTPGVVYYLRISHLIKVGFTTDLTRRLKQYPPNAVLIAQHPGTMQVEREVHNKFAAHLAKGREWFTPCDAIDEHLEMVKATYPQPHRMTKEERIVARKQSQEEAWRRARERVGGNPFRPRPIGRRGEV